MNHIFNFFTKQLKDAVIPKGKIEKTETIQQNKPKKIRVPIKTTHNPKLKPRTNNSYRQLDRSKEKLILSLCNVFGKPYIFKKARPSFLRNPETNRNLEIDIYCKELKLGLEYNSKTHYEFNPFIHKTFDVFEKIRQRDRLKWKLCEEHGVKLYIIPYWISEEELVKIIKEVIEKHLQKV